MAFATSLLVVEPIEPVRDETQKKKKSGHKSRKEESDMDGEKVVKPKKKKEKKSGDEFNEENGDASKKEKSHDASRTRRRRKENGSDGSRISSDGKEEKSGELGKTKSDSSRKRRTNRASDQPTKESSLPTIDERIIDHDGEESDSSLSPVSQDRLPTPEQFLKVNSTFAPLSLNCNPKRGGSALECLLNMESEDEPSSHVRSSKKKHSKAAKA